MIRETLDNLPEGLGGTYKRILVKISRSPLRARLARKIFQWATVALRPLHVEELKEAIAFSPQDKHWEEDKLPNEDLMFESCRGLIIKDEGDGNVHFAHHTVRQYLIGGLATKVDPNFEVSTQNANSLAGLTCVAYLSFSDFEIQLTSATPAATFEQKGVLEAGGPLWIPSVLGIRKPMVKIPYKMLRGDSASQPLDFDCWKYLRPLLKQRFDPSPDLKDKYRLLGYAIENWEPHTRSIHIQDPVHARRFENLAKHKTLAFDFRPWGPNQHFGPYGCVGCPNSSDQSPVAKDLPYISMIHYAAKVGNLALLVSHDSTEMKLKDYLHHERYHQETLLIACRHNRIRIVDNLIKQAEYDVSDGKAVNAAAATGYTDVLQYLLGLGQYPVKQQGHIPLLLAAKSGHGAIISLLAEAGVDFFAYEEWNMETIVESKAFYEPFNSERPSDIFAQTATAALHLAVKNGHVAVIRMLHGYGGLIQNASLDLAAESGHSAVVEVLLENGASFVGIADKTPVHLAAKGGHIDVLETFKKWALLGETHWEVLEQSFLHSAIDGGHENAMRWIVENGVDVNGKTELEESLLIETPLSYAIKQNNETAVRVLLELGADIFEEHLGENICLMLTANDEKLAMLQTLLESLRKDRQPYNIKKLRAIVKAEDRARSLNNEKAADLLEQAFGLYCEGKSYEEKCRERGFPV